MTIFFFLSNFQVKTISRRIKDHYLCSIPFVERSLVHVHEFQEKLRSFISFYRKILKNFKLEGYNFNKDRKKIGNFTWAMPLVRRLRSFLVTCVRRTSDKPMIADQNLNRI